MALRTVAWSGLGVIVVGAALFAGWMSTLPGRAPNMGAPAIPPGEIASDIDDKIAELGLNNTEDGAAGFHY